MNIGPQRLGKYELHELLGQGSMAEVWKAFDSQLERFVAIKLLHANLQNDPDFTKRFIREARVVASLHHPNIVQIYDFQASAPEWGNTNSYMVMDYVEGETLAEYMRNTSCAGKFPPAAEIAYLFTCISSAVDYAHRRSIIHRDIKPSNILLNKRRPSRYQIGVPILTDFGIVKLLGSSTGTLSGWWLGTPVYISPEQAQGHSGNERSDLYSLGVILYEICTGVRPFQGDNLAAILMQHISTMPTPPHLINSKIPPALTDVIMRSLAKDPAARFPNASSMAVALTEALNLPILANLSTPTPVPTVFTPEFGRSKAQLHTSYLSDGHEDLTHPPNSATGVSSIANSRQNHPSMVPSQLPTELLPATRSASSRRRKGLLVTLCALLILVFGGSSLGIFYLVSSKNPVATATSQTVGDAFYVSSGLSSEGGSQGIEDQFRIDLHNIPEPAPDKRYYAWLLSDNNPSPKLLCGPPTPASSLLLGPLSVDHGTLHFLYPSNQQHTNLIGITSRFLITEESARNTPDHPSLDRRTWRYYAELPQAFDPNDQDYGSALTHLRCLLFESPQLQTLGLHVGLAIQFYRNTQSVLEWATRAIKDHKDSVSIHHQIVSILDYLDGSAFVQKDVSGTPVLADNTLAQIPLLNLERGQEPGSYIVLINKNLLALVENPNFGVTTKMRELAAHTAQALVNVQSWLEKVHQDAKRLVGLHDAQLLQGSSLSILEDLETQANYAFNGQFDPSTKQLQSAGVVQVLYDIQSLATYDIMTYSSKKHSDL